jgi:hypothetical protein
VKSKLQAEPFDVFSLDHSGHRHCSALRRICSCDPPNMFRRGSFKQIAACFRMCPMHGPSGAPASNFTRPGYSSFQSQTSGSPACVCCVIARFTDSSLWLAAHRSQFVGAREC